MLSGEKVTLRTARFSDLEDLIDKWSDLAARGDYYAHTIYSETALRRRFEADGFLGEHDGQLLIEDSSTRLVGSCSFSRPQPDYQYYELRVLIFDAADRGRGLGSEAILLLVRHLLANRRINKLLLAFESGDVAARRLAETCGFTREGVDRQAVFRRGRYRDLERYSLVRDELPALR